MSYRYFWLSVLLLTISIKESRSDCLTVPWDSLGRDSYSEIFLGRLDHKRKVNYEIHYTFDVLHKWKGSKARSVTVICGYYAVDFNVDSIYLVTADLTTFKGNKRVYTAFLETSTCANNMSITYAQFPSAVITLNRLFPNMVKLSDLDQRSIYRYSLLSLVLLGLSAYIIRRFN